MIKALFLGPPGVGKGTQAERVSIALRIPHISTGEMFRRHMASKTVLGRRVEEIIARGDLVPDDVTVEMVMERLGEPDTAEGYVLDGFPRNLAQDQALSVRAGDTAVTVALALVAPDRVLTERMLGRGRADDTEVSVRNRLEVYRRETEPLMDEYRRRGLLVTVDGVGEIKEITTEILSTIDALPVR